MALEYNLVVHDNGSLVFKKVGDNAEKLKQQFVHVDKQTNIFGNTLNATTNISNTFGKGINHLKLGLVGLATQGLGKAAGAFIDIAKEMVSNYDSASKLAENIGVTSESIVGLRYAADQSGVGAQAMDKNMAKLSQTISKAGAGNKAATDTFAKMGIEVKNSDGTLKNSTQVMLEMADSFKNLPPGAERATLAMDVFGKSGASMVSMLKDGSAGLREMMDEGSAAAGNIDDISKAMTAFNTVTTRAKAAAMGMMAVIADTSIFKDAIGFLDDLTKKWAAFGKDMKNAKEQEILIANLNKTEAGASLKILANKKTEIELSNEYANASDKQKAKMLKDIEKETLAIQKKNLLSKEEIEYEKTKGEIIALNNKAKKEELNATEKKQLAESKAAVEGIENSRNAAKIAMEKAEEEKKAAAAAIAGYEEQKKKEEELAAKRKKAAEDMARDFKAAMKSKEDAIKSLADLDEKMNIRFLEGEAKKEAELKEIHKKQIADMEALHEKELFNVEAESAAEFSIKTAHNVRLIAMEELHQQELKKIKDEFAEKDAKAREAAIKSIAEIDEKNKMHFLELETKKLDGFKASHEEQKAYIAALENQKQAELKASYEKQMKNLTELQEKELTGLKEGSIAKMEIEAAHNDRILEMKRLYETQSDEIKKEFHEKEKRRIEAERDQKFEATEATLRCMQQVFDGQKDFAGLYKTAAIAEATVNATQSVLKTMAGTPYPFNIPLAAMQAAAAAMQVNKIMAVKMYRGGMIKGGKGPIWVNEEGEEAILNTGAVRAVGGPKGVNALNSGNSYNTNNYNNSSSQSVNITLNSTLVSQEEWRRIEQVQRWSAKRK